MTETENLRVAQSTRQKGEDWLADLAGTPDKHDVYAERREPNAYGAPDALRSREASMTDRYDRNGHELRNGKYGIAAKYSPVSHEDDYYDGYDDATTNTQGVYVSASGALEDEGPEWTYDEKREQWIDRQGNPYVEAYAEGEEDRYAPAEESEYLAPRAELRSPHQRKSRGSAVSLAAIVLVASIGGGLAYAWKKGGFIGSELPGIGSAPAVIKADTDPVKIKPAQTASTNDQTTPEIFDRGRPQAPGTEHIVRHEEQPVAVLPLHTDAAGTPPPMVPPSAARPVTTSDITLPPSSGAPSSDQMAKSETTTDTATTDSSGEPRRVRTIKIMPDSSVVTGDAPITGTNTVPHSADSAAVEPNGAASSAAPTVPDASASPDAAVSPGASPAAVANTTARSQSASDAAAPAQVTASPVTSVLPIPVTSTPVVAPPVSTTVDDSANGTTVVEPAPRAEMTPPAVPPVRPRNIPTTTPTQQVASVEPTPTTSNGTYVVQVSSQKSPIDAQEAFLALQRKYGAVLGGMKASIRKVDLPERGTYYRVRVGSWGSSTEASAFCAKLKVAGGDCVITRN